MSSPRHSMFVHLNYCGYASTVEREVGRLMVNLISSPVFVCLFVTWVFCSSLVTLLCGYCTFLYSCEVSSLILTFSVANATTLLGSMRVLLSLSCGLSICRLVFSDREFDLILPLRIYCPMSSFVAFVI